MLKVRTYDVTATCKKCHDLFDLVIIDRRGELSVEPTRAVSVSKDLVITHRPGHCDGKVEIIQGLSDLLINKWPKHDPLIPVKR